MIRGNPSHHLWHTMKLNRLFILLPITLSLFWSGLVSADFESGMKDQRDGKYESAFEQFELASEAGDERAHGKRASMHLYGLGTNKDYYKAYIWFGIANHTGDKYASRFKKAASSTMTPEQVEAAEGELTKLKEKFPSAKK